MIMSSTENPTIQIHQRAGIEIYAVTAETMGGHGEHWYALTATPEDDVPNWLHDMIDDAILPQGLHRNDDTLPKNTLLLASETPVHLNQVLAVDASKKPTALITTFPVVESNYHVIAKIERIIENQDRPEAVLRLQTQDGTTIYVFDTLYAINKSQYQADTFYQVALSGICHDVAHFSDETMTITDSEAIRHHRALNDILAKNDGEIPDDLQEQLSRWQPQDEVDKLPVTLDLSKMCAYLYGENLGQEDEAWCQGVLLGLQNVTTFNQSVCLLDVAILREENVQPVVVRMLARQENLPEKLAVGDFIRTNVWLQGEICAINVS